MDFSLPAEILQMQRAVRDFAHGAVETAAPEIERTNRVPDHLMRQAADLGLFGLSIPEEYGGVGLSMLGKCAVYEALGHAHMGFGGVISAHASIGTAGLLTLGTEGQKQKYLPRMATGELMTGFAITEPSSGSDAANIKTRAEARGDGWLLNGLKHYISNAPIAGLLTVIAVTDPQKRPRGMTAFLIEMDTPGVTVGKPDAKMGQKGALSAEVRFEDCFVPAEAVLGKVGEGYREALGILTSGRVGIAARAAGAMAHLIELSVAHAKQREQFGKPIADFQAIQFMLAEMSVDLETSRALWQKVAWMVDEGQNVIKMASVAKLHATEALSRVADQAVQIAGGMGYMQEYQVERWYRDQRLLRIYEGTSEIQKLIIARQLLA